MLKKNKRTDSEMERRQICSPLLRQKKVLLYFFGFRNKVFGGAEYLPLLLIQDLLQRGCDITLAIKNASYLEYASKQYGIEIAPKTIRIVKLKRITNRFLLKFSFIPLLDQTRQLKRLARDADICISAANMNYFGKPAHHIVYGLRGMNDQAFYDLITHAPPLTGLALVLRKCRTFLAETILRPALGLRSTRRILSDPREKIYVPSHYVADTLRAFYGPFNYTVFYPPTMFRITTDHPVGRYPMRVIYLGRIEQHKRIEDMIGIVEDVRNQSGFDLTFHIAGPESDRDYAESLQRIARENPWICISDAVYGAEKEQFLLSGTYALHAERDETFGISITEYLKAGVIPIVPDEGGTPEIVDNPALTYHTDEDAAHILIRLLTNEAFRQEQLDRCRERAKIFSFERYMETQHKFLDKILEETT